MTEVADLRVGQAKLSGEIDVLRNQQTANHKQNRDSIHDLTNNVQTLADGLNEVTCKIDDYLLIQNDRDNQRDKAWWKAPLGTGIIVLVLTIGWQIVSKVALHW